MGHGHIRHVIRHATRGQTPLVVGQRPFNGLSGKASGYISDLLSPPAQLIQIPTPRQQFCMWADTPVLAPHDVSPMTRVTVLTVIESLAMPPSVRLRRSLYQIGHPLGCTSKQHQAFIALGGGMGSAWVA